MSVEALRQLEQGVVIQGYKTRPCQARWIDVSETPVEPQAQRQKYYWPPRTPPIRERKNIPTCWIELKLIEGKNRQVRRMTAAVGFPTLRLIRSAIGRLRLEKLAVGTWRELGENEAIT